MAVGEQERHQLHNTLERVLGEREAATMMALTPPVGWGDVARRSDVDHLGVLTTTQLEQFRAEMNGRFEQFETAMNGRFEQSETAMNGRFEQFRAEMNGRFEQFETAVNGRFEQSETAVNGRFEQFDTAINGRFEQFTTEVAARFDQTEERFERKLAENQNKLMIFVTTTTLTAIIAVAGIAFTAAGLT